MILSSASMARPVVGLEMMRSVNEENAEEDKKSPDRKICDQHLILPPS